MAVKPTLTVVQVIASSHHHHCVLSCAFCSCFCCWLCCVSNLLDLFMYFILTETKVVEPQQIATALALSCLYSHSAVQGK